MVWEFAVVVVGSYDVLPGHVLFSFMFSCQNYWVAWWRIIWAYLKYWTTTWQKNTTHLVNCRLSHIRIYPNLRWRPRILSLQAIYVQISRKTGDPLLLEHLSSNEEDEIWSRHVSNDFCWRFRRSFFLIFCRWQTVKLHVLGSCFRPGRPEHKRNEKKWRNRTK